MGAAAALASSSPGRRRAPGAWSLTRASVARMGAAPATPAWLAAAFSHPYSFGMRERNGVKRGQRVRDLDGTPLGRVTALYDWGFKISKGFPILFRKDFVARYDEVRGVRDGDLVIARSRRDLFDLAWGELPPSWRVPAPPGFPAAATPGEAQGVLAEIARGAVSPEVTEPLPGADVTGAPHPPGAPAARERREPARVRPEPAAPPHA